MIQAKDGEALRTILPLRIIMILCSMSVNILGNGVKVSRRNNAY